LQKYRNLQLKKKSRSLKKMVKMMKKKKRAKHPKNQKKVKKKMIKAHSQISLRNHQRKRKETDSIIFHSLNRITL